MTRGDYPTKFMLAFDFADGSVFVGETGDPKLYIRTVMREWRSDERPVVRVVSSFRDIVNDGRGYDIHAKYMTRYRATLAGKLMRARGVGPDGLPRTYVGSELEYHADVIAAAGSIPWGEGELLLIDGLTSSPVELVMPATVRPIGWAIVAGGLGLVLGAAILSRRKVSGFHTPDAPARASATFSASETGVDNIDIGVYGRPT